MTPFQGKGQVCWQPMINNWESLSTEFLSCDASPVCVASTWTLQKRGADGEAPWAASSRVSDPGVSCLLPASTQLQQVSQWACEEAKKTLKSFSFWNSHRTYILMEEEKNINKQSNCDSQNDYRETDQRLKQMWLVVGVPRWGWPLQSGTISSI